LKEGAKIDQNVRRFQRVLANFRKMPEASKANARRAMESFLASAEQSPD
jgi:hypothetical protein